MSEYRYLSDHMAFVLREIWKGVRLAFLVAFASVVVWDFIKISLILLVRWPA